MKVRSAYKKATEVLGQQEVSVRDFADLYGPEVIRADEQRVSDLERSFQEKAEADPQNKEVLEFAKIVEAIIIENTELSDWMGETAQTLPVSRYDDYVNGVDTIVELDEGDNSASHLVLGIDVTIASEMTKKLDRIKREIDQDELAKVKYFSSETLHFRGEMRNIPRVIVALDGHTAMELIDLWMQKTGGKKALADHFIQYQILEEIEVQLQMLCDYCLRLGKKELAGRYDRSLRLVKGIRAAKEETDRTRDDAFFQLKTQLGSLFSY